MDVSESEQVVERRVWRRKMYWRFRYVLFVLGLLPFLVLTLFHQAGRREAWVFWGTGTLGLLGCWILVLAWKEKVPGSLGFGVGVGMIIWGIRFVLGLLTEHPIFISG
jgi:hypothetical protein